MAEAEVSNSQSNSHSQTDSNTEWDMPKDAIPDDVVEAIVQEALPNLDWGDVPAASESESSGATEPETLPEDISEQILEEHSRTEVVGLDLNDKTLVYSKIERDRTRGAEKTGTRPTVAFDYDSVEISEDESGSAGSTAHFDYSKGQQDYRVVVLEGNVNAQAFHLGNLPLRFGRDPANEAILDDVNSSRFHAEIRDEAGQIVVVDLGSTNGVKVNGEIVSQKALECHDVIQIGDCLFEYLLPGVISRGQPQRAAVASELSDTPFIKPAKKFLTKRNIFILGGLFILFAGYQLLTRAPEMAAEKIKEAAAQKAQTELTTIKSTLEQKFQKPVTELNAEDVKAAFMEHFKDSPLLSLLPAEASEQIGQLPPEILQIFVSEPELLSRVVSEGANEEAVTNVLKSKLNELVSRKQMGPALILIEALVKLHPEDAGLKEAQEKLKVYAESQGSKSDSSGLTPDEKKFYEYMEQHENFAMKLIDDKRIEDGIDFSKVVVKNINDLIKADKKFEKVGAEEIKHWEDRIVDLEKKASEKKEKAQEQAASNAEGRKVLDQIKASMNIGDYAEVQRLIVRFMKDYPNHPDREELLELKGEAEVHLEKSFATTQESIERLLEQEGYENAWKELYRFLNIMPDHPRAKDLRALIDKKAGPRATQFYNQARVYEFEADDLVAAEQYYKRSLEISDPQSELHKKASRRYAEVKRRTIQ